jgi:hypothetical protein
LESFIKRSIGKKYSVSTKKLISKWNNVELSPEKESNSYFCSELIGEAYKRMGLLPTNIVSSSYWPGSFASQNKLKLLDGFLTEEMLIDFSIYEKPKDQKN